MQRKLGTLSDGLAASFDTGQIKKTSQMSPLDLIKSFEKQPQPIQENPGLAGLFANVQPKNPRVPEGVQQGYDFDTYTKTVKDIESFGGDYSAKNKKTGAMGAYQFLPSTLNTLKKRTGETFTDDEFVANPKLQDKYFKMLVEDNAKTLTNRNLPVNNFTLWLTHNLGDKAAEELLGKGELSPRTRKFITSNLPDQQPTRENYISHYGPKFGYTN